MYGNKRETRESEGRRAKKVSLGLVERGVLVQVLRPFRTHLLASGGPGS